MFAFLYALFLISSEVSSVNFFFISIIVLYDLGLKSKSVIIDTFLDKYGLFFLSNIFAYLKKVSLQTLTIET
tara:strand:+ start:221 stop:436 length:216 start_codon:yes stop_codon:yes gene_type:complete